MEDRNLLVGHLLMYMKQYNEAQDHFLVSSNPLAALEVSFLHVLAVITCIYYIYKCVYNGITDAL